MAEVEATVGAAWVTGGEAAPAAVVVWGVAIEMDLPHAEEGQTSENLLMVNNFLLLTPLIQYLAADPLLEKDRSRDDQKRRFQLQKIPLKNIYSKI